MAGYPLFRPLLCLALLTASASLACAGTIFDLNFEEPVHHVGSRPTLGAAPDKVSSIVFGAPTVVNDPNPVVNQVLELRAGAVYSQIELVPPITVGPTYTVECDVLAKQLSGSGYGLSILLDTPEVRTVDFHGALQQIATFNPGEYTGSSRITFANDTPYHVRVSVDTVANNWQVTVNGSIICNQRFNASQLYSIRLSVSPVYGNTPASSTPRAYVDNIRLTDVSGNHPPSFLKGPDISATEDDAPRTIPNWATYISTGAFFESSQQLDFIVTSDNPALFSVRPAISPTGTLTFTPAPNASGQATVSVKLHDNGGTANGGGDTSAIQTFKITVFPVNDSPTLNDIANVTLLEDTLQQYVGLSGLSTGAANEIQTLRVTATSDSPALLPAPAVSYVSPGATALLSLAPVRDATGVATVTVTVSDDGTPARKVVRTFSVTIQPVNDAPTFSKGSDLALQESAGPQSYPGWATSIAAGAPDESAQALSFQLSNDNPLLFSVPPAISATGELTFTPVAGGRGSATVTIVLGDDGGTADGGVDQSAPQSFIIAISPFNRPPIFLKGSDITAPQSGGPQLIDHWATAISPGAPYEAGQTLHFVVSTNHPEFFAAQPALTPEGTLTFTPAADASGIAQVTATLVDDGRGDGLNVNTSAAQSFKIRITAGERLSGTYAALVQPVAGAPFENERTGLLALTVSAGGRFTGKLTMQGQTQAIKGRFDDAGVAEFDRSAARTPIRRARQAALELEFQVAVAGGQYKLTGSLLKGGEPFAELSGDRALFVAGSATAPYQSLPTALAGSYTVLLQPGAPFPASLARTVAPAAPGIGVLTVSPGGTARLVASLADGTGFTYANFLSLDREWPIYAPIPGGTGCVSGRAFFRDQPGVSDLDAGLHWFSPADRRRAAYPQGWPSGLELQLLGSKYDGPGSLGRFRADWDGNLQFTAEGGGLETPLLRALDFGTAADLTMSWNGVERLALNCNKSTGLIQGSFLLDRRTRVPLRAVVFPKQSAAFGFFLCNGEAGHISLLPADRPVSGR